MDKTIESICVQGNNLSALCMVHFLRRSGFQNINAIQSPAATDSRGFVIGANVSRLLRAIDETAVMNIAHVPDREQIRLAHSGYILAELPLGKFYADRYGSPLLNVTDTELFDVLKDPTVALVDLANGESSDVQVVTQPSATKNTDYFLWQQVTPLDPKMDTRANVTWLGDDFIAWQFATKHSMYFIWFAKELPKRNVLHPTLHEYIPMSEPTNVAVTETAANMYSGNIAYVDQAVSTPWPTQLPFLSFGIEDTWVLARMLENYEDDLGTALSEYEKYRLPRHKKVGAYSLLYRDRLLHKEGMRRIGRNLGLAFRSRFLPEMAMQQVDWFYQYDCIRGFR